VQRVVHDRDAVSGADVLMNEFPETIDGGRNEERCLLECSLGGHPK
jgi:hypothetical protein